MQTNISKSFDNLQNELQEARNSLKSVDENIKKIIGRDPSDLPPKVAKKRVFPVDDKGRVGLKVINRVRNPIHDFDAPVNKRRNNESVFKRLSKPALLEDLHQDLQKQMISKVIVTSKEVPSREEALVAQNKDEKFRARNRRMFGALLGTLQKFQQEETKLKPREEKRAQLEKKIEEHEIKEKEEIKKERHELFLNRKKKQMEIKIIELKISKMKEYASWEECQKLRGNFILTNAQPPIHYLPRRLNDKTKELLNVSKQNIQTTIEKKSELILEDLKHVEDKMMRNLNSKYGSKSFKQNEQQQYFSSGVSNNNNVHSEETELSPNGNQIENNEGKVVNDDASAEKSPIEAKENEDEGIIQNKENNHLVDEENQESETIPQDVTNSKVEVICKTF